MEPQVTMILAIHLNVYDEDTPLSDLIGLNANF